MKFCVCAVYLLGLINGGLNCARINETADANDKLPLDPDAVAPAFGNGAAI